MLRRALTLTGATGGKAGASGLGSPADPEPVAGGLSLRRRIGLPAGPAVFLGILLLPPPAGMEVEAWRTAALGLLMAIWWISEAIPIPATALLPLALLPVLGVSPIEAAAAPFANPVIFLFLGGFLLAAGMERWSLHRRIALSVIRAVGTRPVNLIAGFMGASAFLSMWVSNTATAVMMLPIGLSVIQLMVDREPGHPARPGASNFAVALMLGIAYAASIGGAATLIGTPPNALFAGFMGETFGIDVGFGRWMLIGVPVALVLLPLAWLLLTRWAYPVRLAGGKGARGLIEEELARLGPLARGERTVGVVFALAAAAWVTRPLLETWIPGISDAGIAIGAALLLFLIPVEIRRGIFVLEWRDARRVPWDVLVLFGGGLSLAAAMSRTGLADWIGASLAGVEILPLLLVMAVVAAVIVFLTELMSNTASAAAFLPVLAAVAVGMGVDPFLLTVPAVLAASCAFMLPVATPPNAIVYGSGFVTVPQMARAGIFLNLLVIALVPLVSYLVLLLFFGVDPGAHPAG